MQTSGNKILITGGASGIGLGLTERFFREGNTVIICGRRENLLREIAARHPGIIIHKSDLSVETDRMDLYSWIAANHSDLNVLINNAGIQERIKITDSDFMQRALPEIAINMIAPVHLTALFMNLASLRTIINVTSGLSFVPMVSAPVYSASKAFLHSFTLSLRQMVKPKNIEVLEIIPPGLNTDLGGTGLHNEFPPVGEFIEALFDQLKQGNTELTTGFSEAMTKAGPEDLMKTFYRMNRIT